MLGNDIKIVVLGVDGNTVKLGIDAPRSLKVIREELVKETQTTNIAALNAPVLSFGFRKPPAEGKK
jgi:carbon storage regulator